MLNTLKINPIWILFAAAAVTFFYYMNTFHSTDVVYLASFMYDIPFLDKYFRGSLELPNLLHRFGEHGMLGYNLLLLINAKYFQFTTYFDFIVNYINIIIECAILIYYAEKNIKYKNFYYYFGIFIIIIDMLNIMQGTSISMETQVRLGPTFFLFGTIYFDKIIIRNNFSKFDLYALIILNIISINIFGTLYIFAMIPLTLIIIISLYFKGNNRRKVGLKLFLIYTLLPFIYLVQYGFLNASEKHETMSGAIAGLFFWIEHPKDILLSVLIYYGSSILGWAPLANKVLISINTYLFIGLLVVTIQIYAVSLFFKNKIYKESYLPIILQSYSFFVLIMIMIGRWKSGDPQWMWPGSYWYQFHTKFSVVGAVLVFMIVASSGQRSLKYNKLIISGALVTLSFGLVIGSISAYIRAPHERVWRENIEKYLNYDIEDIPLINGLTPFIVSKEMTESGLKTLRDNKLLVFSNPKPEPLISPAEILPGDPMLFGMYYSDGWITKKIKFRINTGISGKLSAKFFAPNDTFTPNNIFIYVDGNLYKKYEIISVGFTDLSLTLPKDQNSIIEIRAEKSIVPSTVGMSSDSREIAIILASFKSI